MSRPARWDMATGRLYRQAAALSGKGIRACVRIAAGACPGDHRLGKGVITSFIPAFRLHASWSSSPRLRPPPCRGLRASAFPHFACGGPLGHPQSGDRSSPSHPRELIGRQPHNDALRHGVQLLKFTHHWPSLRPGRPYPPRVHDGRLGTTQMLLSNGAGPRSRKRPVIRPFQASEAVTFSYLQLVSRASALPGPPRRDLRNVSAPRRPQQDGPGAFECRSRNI